jgi:hypothetical protein
MLVNVAINVVSAINWSLLLPGNDSWAFPDSVSYIMEIGANACKENHKYGHIKQEFGAEWIIILLGNGCKCYFSQILVCKSEAQKA